MSKTPPAPPSLEVLRKEIDAIDEQVHGLLMARGDIIDRLISVKQTQEVGSAFRPAREADMMRRLVQRHRGILPLDTVESIWRVHHLDVHLRAGAVFGPMPTFRSANPRCGIGAIPFGFTVPYVSHFSATAAVEAVANSKGDLALVSATSSRTPWWIALEASGAPKIIARLPFVERADHPAGAAGIRGIARGRQRHGDRSRDVEHSGVRLERRDSHAPCRRWRKSSRYRIPPSTGAALLVSVAGPTALKRSGRR